MKTTHTSFMPIACHGCQKETAISTKLGTPIACKCGVVHVPLAVLVASGDDIPKPPAAPKPLTLEDLAKLTPAEQLALINRSAT